MLFSHQRLPDRDREELDRIAEAHLRLERLLDSPRPWTALLVRLTRAAMVRASNAIEGIHVSAEDALAAVDRGDAVDADQKTYRSVTGYRSAIGYVLARRREAGFRFSVETLLAAHFMVCEHDRHANPGRLRPGWVGVRDSRSGELVHEGVERRRLEPLLEELVDGLNDTRGGPEVVRGAMAHLNLAMLHPFSDGNGRTARCLHLAVLATEGTAAPELRSIDEHVWHNRPEYYAALAAVGGGGWNPDRDCAPWIRFCLSAHHDQARTLLDRITACERLHAELGPMVERSGLHGRGVLALLQAAMTGRVRNPSYRVGAGVSANIASRDLKALVDAGLLVAEGDKRGRRYAPAEPVAGIHRRIQRA